MITVSKAENLILQQVSSFGFDKISLLNSCGRVLVENIRSDRDYPPFDRATMDGIGINFDLYKKGIRKFEISQTLSAGQKPTSVKKGTCIKIMTGSSVPSSLDTVIPVEEIKIIENSAFIESKSVKKGQFVHKKGDDKKKGELILKKGTMITPEIIPVLASVGKSEVIVARLPRIIIISTGDELVDIDKKPSNFQIRRSNDVAINACLSAFSLRADMLHVPDSRKKIENVLKNSLSYYDIIILSGGVSKGESDYVYKILEELGVTKIFHGILQKPGKPMWFGKRGKSTIFALPGNPVSTFLCVNRYVMPYIEKCFGYVKNKTVHKVILSKNTNSDSKLTYFTQATLSVGKNGQLLATPLLHNGSGDFMSVVGADVFLELPPKDSSYKKGALCKAWPIKSL